MSSKCFVNFRQLVQLSVFTFSNRLKGSGTMSCRRRGGRFYWRPCPPGTRQYVGLQVYCSFQTGNQYLFFFTNAYLCMCVCHSHYHLQNCNANILIPVYFHFKHKANANNPRKSQVQTSFVTLSKVIIYFWYNVHLPMYVCHSYYHL